MPARFLKHFIFISALWCSLGTAYGQLKSANRHFDNKDYKKAIVLYEQYLAKNKDPLALKNLAECYRLTGNPGKAETCYEQLINSPNPDPMFHFYYGLMLKANKKTDAAKEQF